MVIECSMAYSMLERLVWTVQIPRPIFPYRSHMHKIVLFSYPGRLKTAAYASIPVGVVFSGIINEPQCEETYRSSDMCDLRRLKSTCASVHSNQSRLCPHAQMLYL